MKNKGKNEKVMEPNPKKIKLLSYISKNNLDLKEETTKNQFNSRLKTKGNNESQPILNNKVNQKEITHKSSLVLSCISTDSKTRSNNKITLTNMIYDFKTNKVENKVINHIKNSLKEKYTIEKEILDLGKQIKNFKKDNLIDEVEDLINKKNSIKNEINDLLKLCSNLAEELICLRNKSNLYTYKISNII